LKKQDKSKEVMLLSVLFCGSAGRFFLQNEYRKLPSTLLPQGWM